MSLISITASTTPTRKETEKEEEASKKKKKKKKRKRKRKKIKTASKAPPSVTTSTTPGVVRRDRGQTHMHALLPRCSRVLYVGHIRAIYRAICRAIYRDILGPYIGMIKAIYGEY